MDFGDCHRSLLGHTDSVMCVRFVPKTHYFFSCSKDGSLKYWDADRFEQILHLPAHQSEAWGLAISPDSSMVISGGHDRSIRVWERTEDLVFIEEEKERELESQYEKEMEKEQLQEQNDDGTAKVRVAHTRFGLQSGEVLIKCFVSPVTAGRERIGDEEDDGELDCGRTPDGGTGSGGQRTARD